MLNIVDDEKPGERVAALPGRVRGGEAAMRVQRGWPGWAGDVAVTMMTQGRGFCNAKAKRELGWKLRYPSWRQGFKDELAWSRAGEFEELRQLVGGPQWG